MRRNRKVDATAPVEPRADWTDDFDPSLDVLAMQALGVRRAELEQQLRDEGQTARLAAAQRKLDADYRTEKARLEAEAAARSVPKPAPAPDHPNPGRVPARRRTVAAALQDAAVDLLAVAWRMGAGVMMVFVMAFLLVAFLAGPDRAQEVAYEMGRLIGGGIGAIACQAQGGTAADCLG
jgi:uncharacterized membrane protein YccC